jgi:hypothetical protein
MERDRADDWLPLVGEDWGKIESTFPDADAFDAAPTPPPTSSIEVIEVRIPRPAPVPRFDGFFFEEPEKGRAALAEEGWDPLCVDWLLSGT